VDRGFAGALSDLLNSATTTAAVACYGYAPSESAKGHRRWATLVLLALVYMVSYADRQSLLILVEPIKRF
jgi:hypothetical protein